MLLHSPLSAVTPTVDGDVLAVLAGAEDWFTVTRLQHLIPDRSRQGVRKTLARLVDQGVVDIMIASAPKCRTPGPGRPRGTKPGRRRRYPALKKTA